MVWQDLFFVDELRTLHPHHKDIHLQMMRVIIY
jgi:hypothetical protein